MSAPDGPAVVAAGFYTGLVAELYEPLRGSVPDPPEYVDLVRRFGEPALELGCGGGDPLVALRVAGLDVEGVDSSPDMLAICRAKARAAGVDVVLHEQRMEDLDLGRTYRLVFLAGPTFNLLPDDATARRALERVRAHLAPGGVASVPLFVPDPLGPTEVGSTRSAVDGHGDAIEVAFLAQERDESVRTQRTVLRYRRTRADDPTRPETLERVWELHWYTRDGFADLAARAGLRVDAVLDDAGRPAASTVTDVTVLLSSD